MKDFRTFESAVEFYKLTRPLKLTADLKDQLSRAASSIALNLAEGRGKRTTADQLKFFQIAMGSTRECQAVLILVGMEATPAWTVLDRLAAQIFLLIQRGG